MEDFDLKCLPTDFVGTSRPSKVIEALYERKEKAENEALQNMYKKRQEICDNYEKLFEAQSDELKRSLDVIQGLIKNELYDCKIKTNYDNANFVEENAFMNIFKRIQDYTRKQHELVDNYYQNLVKMEKDKAKEFTDILKITYEEIKRISFKLPCEYDELIELEIEKINQTILCNNRNYVELKTKLQAEIQNFTKNAIQQLQYVKECWVKFLRSQTEKSLNELRNQFNPDFDQVVDKLKQQTDEINENLKNADSITKIQDPNEWLDNIRQTLVQLDQNAQKIMMNYKQAAVLVYNRFFQELKVIEEALAEINNDEQFSTAQTEMYTPTLEEIEMKYDVGLETIQRVWNDLVDQLTKTLDNTYKFLLAGTTLWQKHFRRTELLQVIILKDMENTVKLNNLLSEPYETKLNVLIDTLRQDPSKEKAKKTLDDIKKLLAAMENLYRAQYQTEIAVVKKYKSTQELKVDVLLAEIKRFLKLYPPDLDKDPKLQRKRASQTSEIVDQTEGLIPTQMLFCKYQIGAISNWQFGLWECIGNYVAVARTEIMAETDKWLQTHLARSDRRLEIRLGFHSMRMERLLAYIHDERLEELCTHQSRFEEHKNAVERRMFTLKDEHKCYQDKYENIHIEYKNEVTTIEARILETENSSAAAANKQLLKGKTENCIEEIEGVASEYVDKCDKLLERVKASHIILAENMKLFSEGGNFAMQETKEILKNMDKLEAQVDKVIKAIKTEVNTVKAPILETIRKKYAEVENMVMGVQEEHKFTENILKKRKNLQKELIKEVCALQYKFKTVTEQFEKSKTEIMTNCGNYSYFKEFAEGVKDMVQKLKEMAEYLDEAVPVRFYSDKSAAELPPTSPHSKNSPRPHRTQDQIVQEITVRLFNFEIQQDRNRFFMNLNKILRKYWDDIIIYGNEFYKAHQRCFYLGEDKVLHSLVKLMRDMYKKFFHIQNQCETRAMQDTKEYIYIAGNYLNFLQEYIDTYTQEYGRKIQRKIEQVYDNEVKQTMQSKKEEIRKQYVDLQKKLKSSYGHPMNRRLLENLQIEAEIIHSDAKEMFADIKAPYLQKLEDEFSKAINEYYDLKDLVPEIMQVRDSLQTVVEDLSLKLNEKVNLLRMMVDYCPVEDAKITKEVILSHCKSFLTFYDSQSVPQLDSITDNKSNEKSEPSQESEVSSNEDTYPSSPELSKAHLTTETSLTTNDSDVVLADFRERHGKYCKEVEGENFEIFLQVLKTEWDCAVKRVLELYAVKYDQ